MGATCSNCNCNKDERDEMKLDEKINSNSLTVGGNQY